MIFDNRDIGVLKLCGLCRYLPTGIGENFNVPFFSPREFKTLEKHKLIKMQSNKLSYALTTEGRDILKKFGYSFPKDARMDIKKDSYKRKVRTASFITAMFLAGIDVFHKSTWSLADKRVAFVSALILRSDGNKALAGARFLGILKIDDIAYIPYHIEHKDECILPSFERMIFTSQIVPIRNIKNANLILTGKTLEELFENLYTVSDKVLPSNGLTKFGDALEELGNDFLLVPENDLGVIQLSVMKIAGYKEKLARGLGCDTQNKMEYPMCDGVKDNIPYIIAIDFNPNRVIRLLRQIERINPNVTARVCCLEFQTKSLFDFLDKFDAPNTSVAGIPEENIIKFFSKEIIYHNLYNIALDLNGNPVDANISTKTKKQIQ